MLDVMEGTDSNEDISKQDIPKSPIKTYKWEDVRRSRKRGAYPWTHLTKPPFDGELDPEEYTMDAFRRSRSTSTLGKSETQDEIEDLPLTAAADQNGVSENKEFLEPSTSLRIISATNGQETRAKSEEPKMKRKLSIESSHSRISLPKFGLKDKFATAKKKLIHTLPKKSKVPAEEVQCKKQKVSKPAMEKTKGWLPTVPDQSPVYIHIPLKPPPGEEDEFSKLEFESRPSSHTGSLTNLQRIGSGRKMSLLGILTELKKVHDQIFPSESKLEDTPENYIIQTVKSEDQAESQNIGIRVKPEGEIPDKINSENNENEEPNIKKSIEPIIQSQTLEIEPNKYQRQESGQLFIQEISDDEKKSNKSIDISKPKTPEPIVDEPTDSSADENVSQYLDKEEKYEIVSEVSNENISQAGPSNVEIRNINPEDVEKTRKIEATLSKWKQHVPTSPALATIKIPTLETQRPRAKSEEPKRKRKTSIESSYSRKSLSKLAFIKRLKEAKDKIKFPKFPSFAKSDGKKRKIQSTEPVTPVVAKTKPNPAAKYPEKPVYIHIPLKLPPGQKDEFSHLAEEIDKKIDQVPSKFEENKEQEEESTAPPSPTDIQLIILTPPSDDEILDSNVPETPSESDQKVFTLNIDALKNLAKKSIDTVCPETKKLESLAEDEISDEQTAPTETPQEPDEQEIGELILPETHEVLVDEEDGLKLSDAAIAMINEEIARELKIQELKQKELKQQELKQKELKLQAEAKLRELREQEMKDRELQLQKLKEDEMKEQQLKLQELKRQEELIQLESNQQQEFKNLEEQKQHELKEQEIKPSLKKKVSFKRRTRAEDGERIYEDVQLASDSAKEMPQVAVKPLDSFQSMSVDEEKSYLDKKIIKETSLEDDYNKWSKLNDHDYEPVNPPPDDIPRSPNTYTHQPPKVDNNNKSLERNFVRIPTDEEVVAHEEEDMTAQEVQDRIEDRFFNLTPPPPPSEKTIPKKDRPNRTSQIDTTNLQKIELKQETRKKSADFGKTINETLRAQAEKLKQKLKGIKKPNIHLPQRPKYAATKLKKPNFKKPNFTLPKMPQRPSITLPSLNLTRKESWRNRQLSTESNAGDSTKKLFDFSTYPRIFKKRDREPTPPSPQFATVPRANRKQGPVGSRWANKFKDMSYADEESKSSKDISSPKVIRIPLHPEDEDTMDPPSHTRYSEDIDMDDDFDRENRDIHRVSPFSRDFLKRWDQGEFHEDPLQAPLRRQLNGIERRTVNLDNDEEQLTPREGSYDLGLSDTKEEHSSGSLSEHRRGVLEEIDSDEFFLREKGISQENIEVGKYLSSEIREAFRNPINSLAQLQSEDREYDLDVSDQSEPLQEVHKRKPLRKPKRKKTPHVSKEQISFDRESPEEYPKRFEDFKLPPPSRPKRKSKKNKKKKDVIPYQETIPIDQQIEIEQIVEKSEIFPEYPERYYVNEFQQMYENEQMQGIEQPEIKILNMYTRYENVQEDLEPKDIFDPPPTPPTRRPRRSKSFNVSEPESVGEEIKKSAQYVEAYRTDECFIPIPEPPSRPRRTRSRTLSQSGTSIHEDDGTSHGADSLISDTPATPCVEEPCIQTICDTMGYAVVDKSKISREPPLPPARPPVTPPRTRRSKKGRTKIDKFFTVPRASTEGAPVRPLRNYSTLGSRTSRSKSPTSLHGEEKENIDLGPYIEIEDGEPVRRLQSGEIVQKMRARPLPAPPRPPRRPRRAREIFRDISHERNLPSQSQITNKLSQEEFEPPEEIFPDPDILLDIEAQIMAYENEETVTHGSLVVQPIDDAQILPKHLLDNKTNYTERIVPITYEEEENEEEETSEIPEEFTHLKDPIVSGTNIVPEKGDEEVSEITEHFMKCQNPEPTKEKTVQSDEETSEIPEEFLKLKNPLVKPVVEKKPIQATHEVAILKAGKMQVSDLDVDKLRVNELQANKIVVSELDGVSLQVSEINSKSGNLVISGIELAPHLIQDMLSRLQSAVHEQLPVSHSSETHAKIKSKENVEKSNECIQTKTLVEDNSLVIEKDEEAPPVPPRYDSKTDLLEEEISQVIETPVESSIELLSKCEPEPNTIAQEEPETSEIIQQKAEVSEIVESEFKLPKVLTELQILKETETIKPESQDQEEIIELPPVRPPRRSSQTEQIAQEDSNLFLTTECIDESIEHIDSPNLEHELEMPPEFQNLLKKIVEVSQMLKQPNESSDSLPKLDSEEEAPPRPPQPTSHSDNNDYAASLPPASFFKLRSTTFDGFIEEDIPLPPRRKRHHKPPPASRSSSEDVTPAPRRHPKAPEPTIPQMTGQLVGACATEMDRSLKRLISHIVNNVFHNADGKQDLHVMILIVVILIAGLILLSGDETVTIHHHHWEYFNPPRDL